MTGRNPLSYPCGSAAHRRGEHPSWEGCALPDPPRGRGLGARASGIRSGMGKPGFPTPPRRGLIFTLAIHAARAAHRRGEHPSWEGCALPDPPAGGGMGKPGFPMPLRGGGVGKPGFPTPSSRAYVHVSRPCGCAAHEQKIRSFLGGLRPPKPSHRVGYGETGLPHTPRARPSPRRGEARGSFPQRRRVREWAGRDAPRPAAPRCRTLVARGRGGRAAPFATPISIS